MSERCCKGRGSENLRDEAGVRRCAQNQSRREGLSAWRVSPLHAFDRGAHSGRGPDNSFGELLPARHFILLCTAYGERLTEEGLSDQALRQVSVLPSCLTFPFIDKQVPALEGLVVRVSHGLVIRIVVLSEVVVRECLGCRDPLV